MNASPPRLPRGPPARLPDADRQPRGRHAARARGAARGRRDRLRGHPPHAAAARPPRHRRAGRLASFHEHNEARARRASCWRGSHAGAHVALVSDAGMPLVSDPGFALVRACLARDSPVEVLPGAERRRLPRSWPPACPPRAGASSAFCRASAASATRCSPAPSRRSSPSSPRARLAATLDAARASSIRQRPVAVCRELTKLHEEVRRGSAAELAAHYGEQARGEVVLVIGAGDAASLARAGARALRELVEAGAAASGGGGVARSRASAQRALPRADGGDSSLSAADVLLRHHPDLLRQRGPPPRATRTRRSPPTCWRATTASAARRCSS